MAVNLSSAILEVHLNLRHRLKSSPRLPQAAPTLDSLKAMKTESYWQSSARLPEFPSLTNDLEVDVVIIGAGLTGITAAHLLKREGAKVAVLDRQRCAQADTGHTTAHLTYVSDERLHHLAKHFGRDGAKAVWDAGAAAVDQIHELVQGHASEADFKWVAGHLHARSNNGDRKDRDSLQEDAQLAREMGFDAEFMESIPFFKTPGVRFANQAKFHPHKYLNALLNGIPGDGSHVFENTEVSEVESNPLIVHAGQHKIKCSFVFIATHTPMLGQTGLLKGTLFQSKLALYTSYVLGTKLPRGRVPEGLFWDTGDPYYYLRIDQHDDYDYAIFGGEDCKTGQEENPELVFTRLHSTLKTLLPGAEVQQRWLGQVIETDDGLPFIGENEDRQFIATGFNGNGMTLGTVAAMMARDRYFGRKNPWFDLFAVHRKPFHGGTWRYLTENLDYPYYMVRDRVARAEGDSTDDLKIGQGKILRLKGKKVAAYRAESGQVILRSPVCTHLKCIVRWNAADKTWDCPCHGSRFKPDGEVLSGPAEAPLAKLEE
jgi:glycine/D-amino acid oxidase-like deaminating enzyme/nitrite reductase/ring-hydroxylating ferredoxin subunit